MPRAVKQSVSEILSQPITVAVLGSGGREHALAEKIAQSPFCKQVLVMPGNDGISGANEKIKTEKTNVADPESVEEVLKNCGVELVIIGPDDLLAAGMADALKARGFVVFGPTQAAAKIEWSKSFAKEMMRQADVPTAAYAELGGADPGRLAAVAEELGGYPIVLKYDGLALGKGVRVCVDQNEGLAFLREVFDGEKFKRTGQRESKPVVVAEEFLQGHEVSLFALTDGTAYAVLEPACDHKRLLEGNTGPNTGGMGAYSPVPWLTASQQNDIAKTVFPPLLAQMREAGAPFQGLLYAGLMVRGHDFWVLEFNARFGDPETQALLPRLESDLLPLLWGIATGSFERHLAASPLRWSSQACVNVVAASRGYPDAPEVGFAIEDSNGARESRVFYSSVKAAGGKLVTAGGRVLSVSALGDTLAEAAQTALAEVRMIRFEGMHFRKDVGRLASHY